MSTRIREAGKEQETISSLVNCQSVDAKRGRERGGPDDGGGSNGRLTLWLRFLCQRQKLMIRSMAIKAFLSRSTSKTGKTHTLPNTHHPGAPPTCSPCAHFLMVNDAAAALCVNVMTQHKSSAGSRAIDTPDDHPSGRPPARSPYRSGREFFSRPKEWGRSAKTNDSDGRH